MKSRILVFLDDNGTEQSAPFTEVRFEGVSYSSMQDLMEAIFLNKVNK